MLTISQLADAVIDGTLSTLTDEQISDAGYAVQGAIDPCFIGDEPHLRCEVDRCGLSETALGLLDREIWAETARRQDLRIEADWRQGPVPFELPVAA